VQSLGFDLSSDDKLPSSVKSVSLTSSSGVVAVPRPLSEWRLLSASLCGALWPNAAKVSGIDEDHCILYFAPF